MPTLRLALLTTLLWTACASAPGGERAPTERATPAPSPLALTWLGVAGWRLDAGPVTVLVDPYLSRPALDAPLVSDPAAIAAHAPARAQLVLVSHSHADHLLDAPAVAAATGADLLGTLSTARVARASGLGGDRVIIVTGGEDLAFDGFSVRVIPSLHSLLDHKHAVRGEIPPAPELPMRFGDYEEGGTLAFLVRAGGREVLFLSTANFIERELDGLRPDVAVVATGLRQEVHDYTCRLMRALGGPPLVIANHFDDWRAAPADTADPGDDVRAFVAEVARCSPGTRVVIPRPFATLANPALAPR
ncbi:MAG: MBL fold metallo-hydrolase [Myxococcales bacterium]|nr:MBL fold metallo-hydrolase [Myxococcales bacterium]MCB9737440.1 MBL fold metallo-hydrolase [Deltaproteobacteria bacterium]